MSEWRELKTLQEVAAAQAAGEEIEFKSSETWNPTFFDSGRIFYESSYQWRSRPKKKTKTIVLREALFIQRDPDRGYSTNWASEKGELHSNFIRWLDTPAREVEVDCE
jgi:hypothetical protein